MKSFATAAAFVTSLLASTAMAFAGAESGYLLDVTGKVLVNTGSGFRHVNVKHVINIGDVVFVAEKAGATIHFKDNMCEVVLMAGSVTQVIGPEMCQQAALDRTIVNTLRGTDSDVVITPVNGVYVAEPVVVAGGTVSPYAIAGGILAISAVAFASATLEKDAPPPPPPVSAP
jgi:hypothetical protein